MSKEEIESIRHELKVERKARRNEELQNAIRVIREDIERFKQYNRRFFAHATTSAWALNLTNAGIGAGLARRDLNTVALRALRYLERNGEVVRSLGIAKDGYHEATVWHPEGY